MAEQRPLPRQRRNSALATDRGFFGHDEPQRFTADDALKVTRIPQQYQRNYAVILEPQRHNPKQFPIKRIIVELNDQLRRQQHEVNNNPRGSFSVRRNSVMPNYVTLSTNSNNGPAFAAEHRLHSTANVKVPPRIPSRVPLAKSMDDRLVADQQSVQATGYTHYHTPRTSVERQRPVKSDRKESPRRSHQIPHTNRTRSLLPPTPAALAAIQRRTKILKQQQQHPDSIQTNVVCEGPRYSHLKEFISSPIAAPPTRAYASPPPPTTAVTNLNTPRNSTTSTTTTTSSNGYSSFSPSSGSPTVYSQFFPRQQPILSTDQNQSRTNSIRSRAKKPTVITAPDTVQTAASTSNIRIVPDAPAFSDENYERFNALNISTRRVRRAKPSSVPSFNLLAEKLPNKSTSQHSEAQQIEKNELVLPSPPALPPRTYSCTSKLGSVTNNDDERREQLLQIVSAQNKALFEQNEAFEKTEADIRRIERRTRRLNTAINRLCSLDRIKQMNNAVRDASEISAACCAVCNRDLQAKIRQLEVQHRQQVSTATLMTEWTPCQSCLSTVVDVFGEVLSTNHALINCETKYNALLLESVEMRQHAMPAPAVVSVANDTYWRNRYI